MLGYTRMTPALAEEILNKNTWNRPLRAGEVEKHTRAMLADEWMKNGSTIVIATGGALLDGQHRLFAVCEAGCKSPNFKGVDMIVVRDADPSVLPTIDTGLPRSYADYKKLSAHGTGHTFPYAGVVQSTLRLIYWYDKAWPAGPGTARGQKASHMELDDILGKYPHVPDMVADVCSSDKLKRLGSQSPMSMVYAMAATKFPNEARAWLEILRTGDAVAKHPANVLREKLISARIGGRAPLDLPTKMVYLIKSWNAFAQGMEIAQLRWQVEEPIPAIYGTKQYTGKMAAHVAIAARAAAATTGQEKGAIRMIGKRRRRKQAP